MTQDARTDSGDQPANAKKVRVVYLVPSDGSAKAAYTLLLEKAVRHTQRWYRDELSGKTFTLASPVVAVRKTKNPASYYSTHVQAGATTPSFFDNVYAEANDVASAQRSDPDNVWLVYIDADPACGQGGGCMDGVSIFAANDLRGLAQEKLVKTCPTDPDGLPPTCRWVGGLAHMLGLALGLSHPPDCEKQLPTCDSSALMWLGMYDYPKAHLTVADKTDLRMSAFVSDWSSTTPLGSCNPL